MENCDLVLIEWLDSRQPSGEWVRLRDVRLGSAVKCASVGWLLKDGKNVKVLAPNMGDIDDVDSIQACGIIRIPTRAVTRIFRLKESKRAWRNR